jgi:5-hydroxyisourate hydrolase-like protein (transthyretin family)
VSTGSGYMSYSSGIAKDRVVAITSEQLPDQSRAKEGFVLYKVKPEKALTSGEYALVFYTAEVRVAGFFAQAANSFYDFGVD